MVCDILLRVRRDTLVGVCLHKAPAHLEGRSPRASEGHAEVAEVEDRHFSRVTPGERDALAGCELLQHLLGVEPRRQRTEIDVDVDDDLEPERGQGTRDHKHFVVDPAELIAASGRESVGGEGVDGRHGAHPEAVAAVEDEGVEERARRQLELLHALPCAVPADVLLEPRALVSFPLRKAIRPNVLQDAPMVSHFEDCERPAVLFDLGLERVCQLLLAVIRQRIRHVSMCPHVAVV
mmetsp:Transcript_48578/g.115313  ORF Transcript_48578/g.115313 Transcript_48578/m.115313 type:complete len:236 (+) Transcript_48578:170-877(+)